MSESFAVIGNRRRVMVVAAHGLIPLLRHLPRIAIEEDYAKRLAKLAKLPLGRDEIG